MTTLLNPFPDYAVKRLVVGQDTGSPTVVTAAIGKGRELVTTYLRAFESAVPASSTAALCAVRGDYGTGKTHLLNDVAAQLEEMRGRSRPVSIVRATCIEADPMQWYRTQLGPQLDTLPLYDIALHLYGQAGRTVAAATGLTEAAASVLQEDPTRIRELIRTDHLSADEVSRAFNNELDRLCRDYDQTVRRVLSRLVSSETDGPAREWLRGETLSDRKAELLGVPKAIDSPEQASSVIGAIAVLHKVVDRPFLMLVDEFEHFVRYDISRNASTNVTWLKRLLEQLGTAGALALVAGHWSAWQTTKDYLDRFPQYAPIDLVKLEAGDVATILRERVPSLSETDRAAHAQIIASVTDGNMRRVMSLCNLLFRVSSGFVTPLTEKDIHAAWTSVAQRISQEQVLEDVVAMLTPRGFVVKTESSFHGVPFDLIAEHSDGRVLVLQAKHSETQTDHYDAARKFIDKLTNVERFAPSVLGFFLANGSIDDELLVILRNSGIKNLRWFDLTEREALGRIRGEIGAFEGRAAVKSPEADRPAAPAAVTNGGAGVSSSTTPTVESESTQLKAKNAELEQKLRELDERRHRETLELKERLDRLSEAAQSARYESLQKEWRINPDRAHASYEAMLEKPSIDKRLRYLGPQGVAGVACIGLGLSALFGKDAVGFLVNRTLSDKDGAMGMIIAVVFGIGALLCGGWLIWRAYARVVSYFEFSRQTIQDLYVRDLPIEALSKVNAILRQSIERSEPRSAEQSAIQRLASLEQLPGAAHDYFRDLRD